MQAIGRLWRLGQTRDGDWQILQGIDAYGTALNSRNMEKYATMVTAEGMALGGGAELTDEPCQICCYEVVRKTIGQASNRYAWARRAWDLMGSEASLQEGRFYKSLATHLMARPASTALMDRESTQEVAKRWRFGSEIDGRHFNAGAPLVSDDEGVVHEDHYVPLIQPLLKVFLLSAQANVPRPQYAWQY